ncbi:hypothetical protein CFOL_v3_16753 [Cephalotus follicularis]|uniref:Uncharacterized protein n=1 Tax=Cephalotus follicularis TaxID=3775 RepID=A0A1Q3BZ79_CEPFO|nr:hypothetical protein CFOL_v3_16753 [Cephalotus follicularis]
MEMLPLSPKKLEDVYSFSSSSSCDSCVLEVKSESEESPIRPIFCLKKNTDMKRFEQTEDCFILDFDPFESVDIANLSISKSKSNVVDDDDDLSIITEKGEVACRDYPHSRHLCLKFPFDTTPHHNHCELCYCYVCDSVAPCKYWTISSHCNASELLGVWKLRRELRKMQPATR